METVTGQPGSVERDEFEEYMAGVRSGAIDESSGRAAPPMPRTLGPEIEALLIQGVVLGGTRFVRPGALTYERREHMAMLVKGTNVLSYVQSFDPTSDDVDILAMAIAAHLYERGKLFSVLAGLLVADGVTWSPAIAEANAPRFAQIAEPDELAAIDALLIWLVLDFFLKSRGSGGTFLRFLIQHGRADRGGETRATGQPSQPDEAPLTSGSTTPSSATSLERAESSR